MAMDVEEVKILAAELVRNYRNYVGLSRWRNDDIEVPDEDRIADAILKLPQMPEKNEG